MKAFVTGATGRIGKLLIEELLNRQWAVCALVLPEEDSAYLEERGITIFRGDVTDSASIDRAMENSVPDVLFHLAGYVQLGSVSEKNVEEKMHDVNVNGTHNVLSSALRYNVKNVVYLSSVAIFGPATKDSTISEKTVPGMNHRGPYGLTKFLAHQEVAEFQRRGLNILIFMPGIIYGPEISKNSAMLESILNGRMKFLPDTLVDTSVPLVYGKDLQQAIFAAIDKNRFGEEYILVESSPSVRELATLAAGIVGRKIKPRPISYQKALLVAWMAEAGAKLTGRTPRLTRERIKDIFHRAQDLNYTFQFDTSKVKTELNWQPTPLNNAVKETIDWFANDYSNQLQEGIEPCQKHS